MRVKPPIHGFNETPNSIESVLVYYNYHLSKCFIAVNPDDEAISRGIPSGEDAEH